ERQRDVEVRIDVLLVRQLDVESDREPAALLRAAVRRFHHARSTAGDDRPALFGEPASDATRLLVRRVTFADARRAEDGHGGPVDPVDRFEAFAELVCD